MRLVVVLHAHLPWVRGQSPWSPTEAWLHEALWGCYLPLLDMLARVDARLTLSVSPPLAAMLADPVLRGRFDRHLEAMRALNGRFVDGEHAAAARHYADHLDTIAHTWKRIDRDLLGALRRLHDRGRIELTTTSVSHAYLPGLDVIDGAVDAQLMLGRKRARICWFIPSSTPSSTAWPS